MSCNSCSNRRTGSGARARIWEARDTGRSYNNCKTAILLRVGRNDIKAKSVRPTRLVGDILEAGGDSSAGHGSHRRISAEAGATLHFIIAATLGTDLG